MRLEMSIFFCLHVEGLGDATAEITWGGNAVRRFYGPSRDSVHQV